jgi:hypothetical protein
MLQQWEAFLNFPRIKITSNRGSPSIRSRVSKRRAVAVSTQRRLFRARFTLAGPFFRRISVTILSGVRIYGETWTWQQVP